METLSITLIDVGWGDSILIEHIDNNNKPHYALIDSNDTTNQRSVEIFLKKYFRRKEIKYKDKKPNFEFVMISHWHGDHISELERIIRKFGTKKLYYPKTTYDVTMATMLDFIESESDKVDYPMGHESLDTSKDIADLGNVKMDTLWPYENSIESNENNNSIVLKMILGNVKLFLTGDAEGVVWNNITNLIPTDTKFFKVPHHGSRNGTFVGTNTPWLDKMNRLASLGISGHIGQHVLPHPSVITELEDRGSNFYRTDENYHLTFTTDGNNRKKVKVKYSRI